MRAEPPHLALLLLAVASCAADVTHEAGRLRIEVWAHAGRASERLTLEDQAARFNASQDSILVDLAFLPEGSYAAQVHASAVAGRLPHLLDVDGPYIALLAWQGHLRPLDDLVADTMLSDLLPSVIEQGTWLDRSYALGTFDSGLALYARRSALEAVGVRIPDGPDDAWTAAETNALLDRLAVRDPDGAVLDLKLNYEGEWFTYAFQPALASAGTDLVGWRDGRPVASGALDGPDALDALGTIQAWIADGRVDPNLDDAAFTSGRVALSWSGHWDFPRYSEAAGADLAVLPLPDFGRGTRTGQGSWMWAVPSGTPPREARAAVAFLSFLLRPEEILAMTDANGAVPARRAAIARSALYGPGGPLHLLVRQLEGRWSVPRPRTPAYPFASSVFQDVFRAVRNLEPLPPALEAAAAAIDREVRDNRGYPVVRAPTGG